VIPQANITAWRARAPWSDDAQVEQDLALTRAVVELFAEPRLAGRIAVRGGTALHKLFLHDKQTDAGFLEEVGPLLSTSVQYDPAAAVAQVRQVLVEKLPGDPWRG
jgi:hypothetical protein